ncbi:MAG: nucleotidyltransferase domain-containing protein [Bacteroidales bacterium]|nr:nucleotidyltransferase domain-containing protein [Bacteroidales bacterium]
MQPFSEKTIKQISKISDSHHVEFLFLFGSSLTKQFSEKSDYDFLVRFGEFEIEEYFDNYLSLKNELENLLGINIDLLEFQTLTNPYLKESIKQNHKLIYGRKNTKMAL